MSQKDKNESREQEKRQNAKFKRIISIKLTNA